MDPPTPAQSSAPEELKNFPAPKMGPFPPKRDNEIYIPTKKGWVTSLALTPTPYRPPEAPPRNEEIIQHKPKAVLSDQDRAAGKKAIEHDEVCQCEGCVELSDSGENEEYIKADGTYVTRLPKVKKNFNGDGASMVSQEEDAEGFSKAWGRLRTRWWFARP